MLCNDTGYFFSECIIITKCFSEWWWHTSGIAYNIPVLFCYKPVNAIGIPMKVVKT